MPCRRSRSRSRQARDADSRATSRAAAIARDDNARRAPRHDAPRRTTAQTDALRPTPSRLPAFQPSSLPAFQPSSLPAFQDDRRAPPLFFRHAPSRSASRMSPRLGAIAHDPPVARDSIRAADAGRAASPEPRSRAAPRKTGQRNAPPVAPPTCRHADMPHCRHCRHCRRSPAKPLVLTRQATQPHTHSATGVPSALHRRSVDERADNERSTPNARDRDAPRGAPRMRARSNPRIARAVIPACCSMPSIPGSRRAARGRALRSRPTPRRSPRAANRCTAPTAGPPAAPRRHRNCIAY
ncbi:Uncharacterised protein [Burkholderia pseudomallei]|nr:Uncharacterised protein [Burkholderia pseudomallei]CAJ5732468.1 Uncharacterised protein [Burkholderia pseudomallei]CAJ7713583.1 Uncharacterised protein [Burkholderia pseudomallei]CAJ8193796.1 Uncharacterised protein [Burkholderia pseudomallei]CAK0412734.1 Uncharacterised protein [Burkholderia pseudomallei]